MNRRCSGSPLFLFLCEDTRSCFAGIKPRLCVSICLHVCLESLLPLLLQPLSLASVSSLHWPNQQNSLSCPFGSPARVPIIL